jgi:DNA-binding response OmpR family regulator/HPt (histidine-containing phosphotransfer) domain-containing protein
MKILLIEEDQSTSSCLIQALAAHYYTVHSVTDGQEGVDLALTYDFDLILLNLMIPKVNGIDFCQQLRAQGNQVPILLMTTHDSIEQGVRGLEAGADDYVVKPLDLTELLAKIRALLRRRQLVLASTLTWENLRLDTHTREARYGNHFLRLTPKEFGILEILLRHPQRVFSRSAILDKLWDFAEPPTEETVTSHIRALRRKLETAGATQNLIETVYGLGYRLKSVTAKQEPSESLHNALLTDQAPVVPPLEELHQGINRLREQFRNSFSTQLQVLKQAVQAIADGTITPELHHQGVQECHKLAGSLGTYGYPKGSLLARQIEALLRSNSPLTPDYQQQLLNLVALLVGELEQPATLSGGGTAMAIQWVSVLVISQDKPFVEQVTAEEGLQYQNDSLTRNFLIQIAVDLDTAKKAIAESAWDMILLDLTNVDIAQQGLAFLQDLGQQFPAIPVLVMTQGNNLAERVEVIRLGGQVVLQKPVLPKHLCEILNQLLNQKHPATRKVLVVDDDPATLAGVKHLLEPWGILVQTLQDPTHFLEALNSFLPDLLILDVEMPQFNGIDLCQVVRNDPTWRNLPVLFLTLHTEADLLYRAFASGADDYIYKPIVESELVTRVVSRLDRLCLLQRVPS